MAKAPTQSELKKMMAAQAAAQVKSGKRPPPPKSMFDTDDVPVSRPMPMPMPGGGRSPIPVPPNPNRPMPMPMPGKPRPGKPGFGLMPTPKPDGGAFTSMPSKPIGPVLETQGPDSMPNPGSAVGGSRGGKGGPRPMGPGQVAQMAQLADMAGMQRMKGGGYLKKNIDGKASKGKTKGRNC